ncbi:hypothetical protein B0J14DRAFT_661743 [Halenospora varia]|nr:hypothetical protein B0J14DRAFT_661743 [Halenospora varia]
MSSSQTTTPFTIAEAIKRMAQTIKDVLSSPQPNPMEFEYLTSAFDIPSIESLDSSIAIRLAPVHQYIRGELVEALRAWPPPESETSETLSNFETGLKDAVNAFYQIIDRLKDRSADAEEYGQENYEHLGEWYYELEKSTYQLYDDLLKEKATRNFPKTLSQDEKAAYERMIINEKLEFSVKRHMRHNIIVLGIYWADENGSKHSLFEHITIPQGTSAPRSPAFKYLKYEEKWIRARHASLADEFAFPPRRGTESYGEH